MSSRTLSTACALFLCLSALLFGTMPARAQGGPPMVTDDPETPGDGHWEVNIAALGSRNRAGRWDLAIPDADVNYGWGEHIQLKLDVPWAWVREPGQPTRAGLGMVNAGVKWRFVDEDDSGYSVSTYPQFLSNWLASSKRRDITSPNSEFFLPIEWATKVGGYGLDVEAGRNFVQHDTSSWILGGIVAHSCGVDRECMVEVRESLTPHDHQSLLNLGMHWKMSDSLIALGSVGREFGPRTADQQGTIFYIGVQWQH